MLSFTPVARIRKQSLVLALLLASIGLPACAGMIRAQETRIERKLTRSGLRERAIVLEPNTHVQVWEGGEGSPVVLLHGFGVSAPWQWHPQVEALVAAHRVVIPNLLWFGDSRIEASTFTLQEQVVTIAGLLRTLDVEHAAVIGVSYGGLVAAELARTQPALVERLVLVDSPGHVYTAADHEALLARFGVENIEDLLLPTDENDVARLLTIGYDSPPRTTRLLRRAVLRTLYRDNRSEQAALLRTLVADMQALSEVNHGPQQPTLVVWGRNDQVFPLALGQRLAMSLSAELHVVDDARHAPNIEQPETFNHAVLSFLDSAHK